MGAIKNLAVAGLIGVSAFYLGKGCTSDTESNYVQGMKLKVENQTVQLYDKETNKAYDLTKVGQNTYLGDALHNAMGFQVLTEQKFKDMYSKK